MHESPILQPLSHAHVLCHMYLRESCFGRSLISRTRLDALPLLENITHCEIEP